MVTIRLDHDLGVRAILTRPIESGEPRILFLTENSIHQLLGRLESPDGSDIGSRLKLGPAIPLSQRRHIGEGLEPFSLTDDDEFWRATCDAATGLIYIATKCAIFQLDITESDNVITLLAGVDGEEETFDGPGDIARVDRPFCMVADGHGSLLIKDCGSHRIRRVVLPPAGSPSGTPSPLVITLPTEYINNLWAVAIDFAQPQQMYVATKTAVYKHDTLPYCTTPPTLAECDDLAAALAAAEGVPPPDDPSLAPVLLAGREGDNVRRDGIVSRLEPTAAAAATSAAAGPAGLRQPRQASGSASSGGGGGGGGSTSSARFGHITYMGVDAAGRLLIVEREAHNVEPCLRIVWPCGLVTSFTTNYEVTGSEFVAAVLPGGWLALHAWDATKVQLLHLGPDMKPSAPPHAAAAAAAAAGGAAGGAGSAAAAGGPPGLPGLDGLAADLAALLEDGGGGAAAAAAGGMTESAAAADVTVVVGDRSFGCHRAILAARCEFFRRLFQNSFADSSCSKLSLPDADPAAFSLLLRYLYCASMDFPPPLLRPLAELADRLLLPAASRTAQQQLLAASCPASVVEDLLWAEARGFGELLAGLKDLYLTVAHRVLEEAPESLETLMTRSPRLHLELYAAGIKRARRA